MNGCAARFRAVSARFARPLIGVVVAYAVAAESLLIVLGGFSLPGSTPSGAPAVELCRHDLHNVPELPVDNSKHSQCTHCVFCFGASHCVVVGAASAVFHRAYLEAVDAPWVSDKDGQPHLGAYSIANPRGPPFAA